MPFFRRKPHSTIEVRFIDVATGKMFRASKMPPDRLPESFEAHTTMHLGDQDWEVIEATPMTSADFRRTGRLDLRLSRVEIKTMDPKEILFSLPSICDQLPPVQPGSSKLGKNVLEIHEDDWRQVEWIAQALADQAMAEIDQIRDVHTHAREQYGFRRLHLRQAIKEPLAGTTLPIDALKQALISTTTWLDGVSYQGVAGIIQDSFAIRTAAGTQLYGLASTGILQAICFTQNIESSDIAMLCQFASDHALLLVDWCRCAITAADPEHYAKLLD